MIAATLRVAALLAAAVPGAALAQYAPDDSVWINGRQVRPYRSQLAPPQPPPSYSAGYVNGYQNGYANGAYGYASPPSPSYSAPPASSSWGPSFDQKYGFTSRPR